MLIPSTHIFHLEQNLHNIWFSCFHMLVEFVGNSLTRPWPWGSDSCIKQQWAHSNVSHNYMYFIVVHSVIAHSWRSNVTCKLGVPVLKYHWKTILFESTKNSLTGSVFLNLHYIQLTAMFNIRCIFVASLVLRSHVTCVS